MDELLRAVRGAQNAFVNLAELSEEELERIKERYAAPATEARRRAGLPLAPGPAAAEER